MIDPNEYKDDSISFDDGSQLILPDIEISDDNWAFGTLDVET
jgi:hypothetical protein